MRYLIICMIVMMVVTYLPRMLPICFIKTKIKSKFIRSFLYYMPYSVLASLTFPYIIYSTNNIYIGLITTLVVIILSLFKRMKLALLVLIAVLLSYFLSFIL